MYLDNEMKFIHGYSKYQNTNGTVRFCIYFFISIAVLIAMYICMRNSAVIEPFLDLNALLASSIWDLFGNYIYREGAFIYSTDFGFHVTAECTSIAPTFIFISAVIAWPSTLNEKLCGILIGAITLFFINLIRILTLFYIGASFPNYLDLFHYYIWQAMIVLLALGIWLFWIDKMVHDTALQSSEASNDTT
jgi:exosortase/archaeosortase family protein